MTFQDDLDYAKQLVVLRDAFISGEMATHGYIDHIKYEDADVYRYTLPSKPRKPPVFRVNQYEFDLVSSFQIPGGESDLTLFHHNHGNKMWVPEIEDWLLTDEFECSEGFHFQQSLLYSEQTVKEMLTIAYLIEHPMPEPYKYFRMNLKYFYEMQGMLNIIRSRKKT